MRGILFTVGFVVSMISGSAAVFAAGYPDRPVHVEVGFSAGSGVDVLARIVAEKLSESLGQPFIIENRPGAGSNIGTRYAAQATPDGYTLFVPTVANAINATLYRNLDFDFLKDFSAISLAGTAPNFLVVKPSLQVKTVADYIQFAKSNPKSLTLGSSGNGTVVQMAGELFRHRAGIDVVPVPFKGGPEATSALLGGQIDSLFAISSTVLPYVAAGSVRALAVTSRERSAILPQVPTLNESGMPGFEAVTWFGFAAPKGTPPEIISRLNKAIVEILTMPDVKEKLIKQGIDVASDTPDEFAAFMRSEFPKWNELVKSSGATIME
jgi:tripartite-type tricarboxylate transporter receptor subunit TctC